MSDQHYKIVFEGRLVAGYTTEQARENIQALFRISDARVEQLFSGQPTVMKSGLDQTSAEKYAGRLRQAGADARMVPMTTAPQAPARKQPAPAASQDQPVTDERDDNERVAGFLFHGNGKEYFGIWIVNILLTIVTLGIYSAWAKVRNLQYFYGNTELDGASFQFLASPITILKGRLVALAAVIAYTVVFSMFPLVGILLMVALVFAAPWMIVRSLRFNAINTAYRNIRFDFQGRYLNALMLTLIWPIANAFCLFLLTPLIAQKGHQFLVEGSRYGTTAFQWQGETGTYYKFFGIGVLLATGVVIAAIALSAIITPIAGIIVGTLGYLGLFGYFKAGLENLMISHSGLRGNQFESELEPVQLAWIYVSNSFLIAITLGLFIPWAKVRLARYRAECASLTIRGNLDHFLAAERQRTSALGEELGEAFDVGFAAV